MGPHLCCTQSTSEEGTFRLCEHDDDGSEGAIGK